MISIAMALYNSTRYIEEQFDSIRNQTVPVDEVVMIDDCSKDDTTSFVKQYIEKHNLHNWKIFNHKENKGYIYTFTDALCKVSGDIIILCDHDDIWLPNKIEIIKSQFDAHSNILSLATSFIQIDSEGKTVEIKQKWNHGNNNLIRRRIMAGKLNKMTLRDVAIYNISPGCTCAIRSSLRDQLLSDNHEYLPHDWKLNILAAIQNGLYYLDIPTTKYRIYDRNTIGLGHVNAFIQRKNNVIKNWKEKKDATSIIEEQLDSGDKVYIYYKNVENVFELRKEFMLTCRSKYIFEALLKSVGMGKLYESILMDYISAKRKIRND